VESKVVPSFLKATVLSVAQLQLQLLKGWSHKSKQSLVQSPQWHPHLVFFLSFSALYQSIKIQGTKESSSLSEYMHLLLPYIYLYIHLFHPKVIKSFTLCQAMWGSIKFLLLSNLFSDGRLHKTTG
jgi:hypothetical protein